MADESPGPEAVPTRAAWPFRLFCGVLAAGCLLGWAGRLEVVLAGVGTRMDWFQVVFMPLVAGNLVWIAVRGR